MPQSNIERRIDIIACFIGLSNPFVGEEPSSLPSKPDVYSPSLIQLKTLEIRRNRDGKMGDWRENSWRTWNRYQISSGQRITL